MRTPPNKVLLIFGNSHMLPLRSKSKCPNSRALNLDPQNPYSGWFGGLETLLFGHTEITTTPLYRNKDRPNLRKGVSQATRGSVSTLKLISLSIHNEKPPPFKNKNTQTHTHTKAVIMKASNQASSKPRESSVDIPEESLPHLTTAMQPKDSQRTQYPLIEAHTLNHSTKPLYFKVHSVLGSLVSPDQKTP